MKIPLNKIPLSRFLTFCIISTVVLFGLTLSISTFQFMDKFVRNSQQLNLENDINSIKSELTHYLDTYRISLEDNASYPIIVQGVMQPSSYSSNIEDHLNEIKILQKDLRLTLLDFEGNPIFEKQKNPDWSYIKTAELNNILNGTQAYLIQTQKHPGGYSWDITVPVIYNGSIEGALQLQVPVNLFMEIHKKLPQYNKMQAGIFFNGENIASWGNIKHKWEKQLQIKELDITLKLKTDNSAIASQRRILLFRIIFALITGGSIFTIIMLLIGKRYISMPILKLQQMMEDFSNSQNVNLHFKSSNTIFEIADLTRHFELMYLKINDREIALKRNEEALQKINKELAISENHLKKSLSETNQIIKQLPAGVLIMNDEQIIQEANDYATNILGIPLKEIVGKPYLELIPNNQNNQVKTLGVNISESTLNNNSVILKSEIPVSIKYNHSLLSIFIDISKQKQLEEEQKNLEIERSKAETKREQIEKLEKTNKKLSIAKSEAEAATKVKDEFLANLSHEIRTPLNAVLGIGDSLYRDLTTKKQQKKLTTILKSSNHLLQVVNDILDFSKIEAGKLKLEYSPVSLNAIITETVKLFTENARRKGIEINMSIATDIPPELYLDELRIKQILSNLIGNAVKFTQIGYVAISASFNQTNDNSGQLEINIEDTGIGIPKTDQLNIFDAFKQQNGQSNRKFEGTGLGLAIVKKLTEQMGGTVNLESSTNNGAKFSLSFPYVELFISDINTSTLKNLPVQENIEIDNDSQIPLVNKLSLENISALPKLIETMSLIKISDLTQNQGFLDLSSTEELSNNLIEIAIKFNFKLLKQLGEELLEHTKSVDIESIIETKEEIAKLFEELHNISK